MSTPLFERLPIVGLYPHSPAVITGQSLAGLPAFAELLYDVPEPTLIEEIRWSAIEFSSLAGMMVIAIRDVGYGGAVGNNYYVVGAFPLKAGTGSLWANDRIPLNLTLPAGFSLEVAHSVQSAAGPAYTGIYITAWGGIVR